MSAGKTVKQVVQIMFIYFGLAPSAIVMAIGFITGHPVPAALITAAMNAGFGMIFFVLLPRFLDPGGA